MGELLVWYMHPMLYVHGTTAHELKFFEVLHLEKFKKPWHTKKSPRPNPCLLCPS